MRTDNTRDERAKRAREKKLAAGLVSRALYLPAGTIAELQTAFPGPAGGIEWARVADAALRPSGSPDLPADTLAELQAAFGHQGGGIDWGKVADLALTVARRQAKEKEKRAAGLANDPTANERARRYRERNRDEIAARARARRAAKKAGSDGATGDVYRKKSLSSATISSSDLPE